MNPDLMAVQAPQILKWFLAIGANDRYILVYFLVFLEIQHGSVTFSTLIAYKVLDIILVLDISVLDISVLDISVDGMYPHLVLLQITFLIESFPACVARM